MYKEYTGTYTHRHAGICTRAYLYSKDVSAPRRCQAQNPVKHLKPETLNPSPALYRQLCQENTRRMRENLQRLRFENRRYRGAIQGFESRGTFGEFRASGIYSYLLEVFV